MPGTAHPVGKSLALPAALLPVLLLMLVFFAGYLAYEIYRWRGGNRAMLTPGQFRRRMTAGILLLIDMAMWLAAGLLPVGVDVRVKLLYLSLEMLFAVVPMMLAVREAAFIARQYARWRGDLARSMGRDPRSNGST
jgi:hypothetical protein